MRQEKRNPIDFASYVRSNSFRPFFITLWMLKLPTNKPVKQLTNPQTN